MKSNKNWQTFNYTKKTRRFKNKVRNERGVIETDTTEIERIIRDYYEHVYSKRLDNLEKDKLLETCNSRMNHDGIEILNRPITSKGIE